MPAINIRFEQNELDTIRDRARHEGRSLQSVIHDAALNDAQRRSHRERVAQAVARVGRISAELDNRLENE